jgi:beta-glucosidase
MTRQLKFPTDFVWGTATAAYQIEGGADADGRVPSIWDTFSHTAGNVANGDTGDVACDHYHRSSQDLDLMATLGIPAYRFSVSWPRVMPSAGTRNAMGLDFYDQLVDGLLERDITPLLTLYHWDLPQYLQDSGGWTDRTTVDRFVELAELIGHRLGDRVSTMTTLNEPFCSAFLGYAAGIHAPGLTDNAAGLAAAHHLNLAHGRAVTALREVLPAGNKLSITLNLAQVEPASPSAEDRAAADHVDDIANKVFLEPILRGRYPERLIEQTQHITDWSFVQDGDLAEISAPIDVLGINYYSPARIAATDADRIDAQRRWVNDPAQAADGASLWPGTDLAMSVPQPGPYTAMGWRIAPGGLTRLLLDVHESYPDVPLVVTENGCAYDDEVDDDGRVRDPDRVAYLRSHVAAVHDAIAAGADVRGYYLWSFMDNFEWAWGYSQRFGIVHVDYDTLVRTPKESAIWFRDVIKNNAVDTAP